MYIGREVGEGEGQWVVREEGGEKRIVVFLLSSSTDVKYCATVVNDILGALNINFAIPLTIPARPLLLVPHEQCRTCLGQVIDLLFMVELSRRSHIKQQGSQVSS